MLPENSSPAVNEAPAASAAPPAASLLPPEALPPELAPARLRWCCDPAKIPFETTADAELAEGVIGQERAIRAIQLGLEVGAPGYNTFICGLSGSSRGGLISRMIR